MLSRVADSLYWMGRYIERSEHIGRLLLVRIDSAIEQNDAEAIRSWRRLLAGLQLPVPTAEKCVASEIAQFVTKGSDNPSSLMHVIAAARDNARQVREQISSEMWETLNRLYLRLRTLDFDTVWRGATVEFYASIINDLYLLHGVTTATMRQAEGWHFLQLGRYIERAQLLCRLIDVHFGNMPAGVPADLKDCDHFEWLALLRGCGGFEAYTKVYTADVRVPAIADFLIFDPLFPRALRFAVDRVAQELTLIGRGADENRHAALMRLAGRLKAKLDYGHVDEVLVDGADRYLDDVQRACEGIHVALCETYIGYGIDTVVAA